MKFASAVAAVAESLLAWGATVVLAQQDPIAARKALMKANGQGAGALAKMVKGEAPFDLRWRKRRLRSFEDAAAKMPALFPDNSKIGAENSGVAEDLGKYGRRQSEVRQAWRRIAKAADASVKILTA